MLNVSQSLQAISLYPINPITLENICEENDIAPDADCTSRLRKSTEYKRAKAAVYQYLADAPNVNEAGAAYNLTDEQRADFKRKAAALLAETGDADGFKVGYIGCDF